MGWTGRRGGLWPRSELSRQQFRELQIKMVAGPGFEPAGASGVAAKPRVPLLDKGSLLPVSRSLIAPKFSLLSRLGNSVGKRLNFLRKAEAPWLSQAPKPTR